MCGYFTAHRNILTSRSQDYQKFADLSRSFSTEGYVPGKDSLKGTTCYENQVSERFAKLQMFLNCMHHSKSVKVFSLSQHYFFCFYFSSVLILLSLGLTYRFVNNWTPYRIFFRTIVSGNKVSSKFILKYKIIISKSTNRSFKYFFWSNCWG